MGFQPGDTVQLKSGGPVMTVESIEPDGVEDVLCLWFDGMQKKQDRFASASLAKADPNKPVISARIRR